MDFLTPAVSATERLVFCCLRDLPEGATSAMDAAAVMCREDDVNALRAYLVNNPYHASSHLVLFAAAEAKTSRCLQLLLENGDFDANLRDPENGQCLLSVVAENSDSLDCITKLLQAGADPNLEDNAGMTPLHYAARSLRPASVRALLTAGAKVDQADIDGCTALYFAVETCFSAPSEAADAVVQLLLDAGADVHHRVQKNDITPLHMAAAGATTVSVLRLLMAAAGGDLNRGDATGRTPLMLAISFKRTAAFAELLEHGADVHVRTMSGRCAIICAALHARRDGTDVVRALVRRGAEFP